MEICKQDQPESSSATNMQMQFLQNFPKSKQQKLLERWFAVSHKQSQIDSAEAIEEKLALAESRRLANLNEKKNTEDKGVLAQMKKIDNVCAKRTKALQDNVERQLKAQQRKSELLNNTIQKCHDHNSRVGREEVNQRKQKSEDARKQAVEDKHKKAEERKTQMMLDTIAKRQAHNERVGRIEVNKRLQGFEDAKVKRIDEKHQKAEKRRYDIMEFKFNKAAKKTTFNQAFFNDHVDRTSTSLERLPASVQEDDEEEVLDEQLPARAQSLDKDFYKGLFQKAEAEPEAVAPVQLDVLQKIDEPKPQTFFQEHIVTVNGEQMKMKVEIKVNFEKI